MVSDEITHTTAGHEGPYTLQRYSQRFSKTSLGKSLSLYETVEKIVSVVKKSCSAYGQ